MTMPRPIFILGQQRSGTTWVGNLLAAHQDVAAVTDVDHQGIHESVFFSHFAQAWDWSDPARRDESIRAFAESDYGQIVGVEPGDARSDPAETFRIVMDRFAAGRVAWVEKSPHHLRHAWQIAAAYPDAQFVLVQRDAEAMILSRLRAYGRPDAGPVRRLMRIARSAATSALVARLMASFEADHPGRCHRLSYETMKADPEAGTAALLAELDLAPAPGLRSPFAPNTSHPDGARAGLGLAGRLAARIGEAVGAIAPVALVGGAWKNQPFPHWVWQRRGAPSDPAIRVAPSPRI
ncbi:sulfotransferase family protein [Pelagovum pacificum]|uniref:Sulfotransferase n=1 Tax=Pelagovum pacificum TaxID=2588711 RepID=A0A5C5GF04_9RHOB|nr:sulfotransferase [Pelagovum pacificum]QQA43550.1 sulfotransferase [Pelagovum pacificum]TNY33313.1 sulfotransferase [Pelagovum pacificum]